MNPETMLRSEVLKHLVCSMLILLGGTLIGLFFVKNGFVQLGAVVALVAF